jgi:hypothetical protein
MLMSPEKQQELIDRYLQAVRFFLPKKQRRDVARELSEDLQSRIEERESEVGRALYQEELEELLQATGHPMLLALGYQQDRYLISPRAFPLYWLAVKALLGILAVVHLLLPGIFYLVLKQSPGRAIGQFVEFPGVALPVLAWMTLLFVLLDSRLVWNEIERALAGWKPSTLPRLFREKDPRAPGLLELILTTLFGTWWLVGLHHPSMLLGPAAERVGFGEIFYELYVPMVVVVVAAVVFGALRWLWSRHRGLLWTLAMIADALGLVVLYLLFSSGGPWVVAKEAFTQVASYERLLDLINLSATLGLGIALLIAGADFAWKFLRPSVWPRRHVDAAS